MTNLAIHIGDRIDAFWKVIGLDFYAFSQRRPKLTVETGIWCLSVGRTIGYACRYYFFAALLLTWDDCLGRGKVF